MPTHRTLADSLGLSVHTVSKAYDSLRRQNLIYGQVGRGSYVLPLRRADDLPYDIDPQQRDGFDLSISRPIYGTEHVKRMQSLLQALRSDLDPRTYLACRPNVGLPEHRLAGKVWLSECGLETDVDSVIVTNGASHGMSAALSALTRQGDVVLTDMVAHHLTVSASAYFGLQLFGVATDEHGILPDALEAACREKAPKVLLLLPNAANPCAYIMPEDRRREISNIAGKYDLFVIENDAFGPVVEDRPTPVSALAPERSVYLTTLSKCTMSGLRVGYLAAPQHLLPPLIGRSMVFGWMAPALLTEMASRWVQDGTAMELAIWQREQMRARHEIICRSLVGFDWQGCPTGLHVWLRLPSGWTSDHFSQYARQFKVAVAPERPFLTPNAECQNAVRLSKGSTLEADRFTKAMDYLAKLLSQPQTPLPQALY